MSIKKKYRPPHIQLDKYVYFFSIKTYKGLALINSPKRKRLLFNLLQYASDKYFYKLTAWVILDNHVHFMVDVPKADFLSKFINLVSGKSAIELNKLDNTKGRKVWYQYWDHCIRDEKDYYMHLNYIHQNPVKHRLIENMDTYEFSSYKVFKEKYGNDYLLDSFRKYPIIDFNPIWE